MQLDGHPYVIKTLASLLDLMRELDAEIPNNISEQDRQAWKVAQLGMLLAGVQAALVSAGIGTRALVRKVQHDCTQNPDTQVLLDRFKSVAPPNCDLDPTLNLEDVKRGVKIAESAVVTLPGPTVTDAKTYASWMGAIAGYFIGLVDAGFDDIVYDALETSRSSVLALAEPDYAHLITSAKEKN